MDRRGPRVTVAAARAHTTRLSQGAHVLLRDCCQAVLLQPSGVLLPAGMCRAQACCSTVLARGVLLRWLGLLRRAACLHDLHSMLMDDLHASHQASNPACLDTAGSITHFTADCTAHYDVQAISTAFQESEAKKAEKEQVVHELPVSDVLPEEIVLQTSPSIQTKHLQLSRRANLLAAEREALGCQSGSDPALQGQQDSGGSAALPCPITCWLHVEWLHRQ